MIPRHRLIVTVGLTSFTVGLLAATGADDRPPPVPPKVAPSPEESPEKKSPEYPPNATDAEKRQIDLLRVLNKTADAELRKKLRAAYPFESLEDRLKFDAPGRKRVAKSFPTGDLDLGNWKPLVWTEEDTKIPPAAMAALMAEQITLHTVLREAAFDRMKALADLHQLEVKKFVTNPGFGSSRMPQFRIVEEPEKPPTDWSEGDRGESVNLPKTGESGFFNPSQDKKGPTLPSVSALVRFHTSTAYEFTRPDSWGLVKDKTQVAGFLPCTRLRIHPRRRPKRAAPGVPRTLLSFSADRQRLGEKPIKDKDDTTTDYPLIERLGGPEGGTDRAAHARCASGVPQPGKQAADDGRCQGFEDPHVDRIRVERTEGSLGGEGDRGCGRDYEPGSHGGCDSDGQRLYEVPRGRSGRPARGVHLRPRPRPGVHPTAEVTEGDETNLCPGAHAV